MPADTPALDALLREVDRCEADLRAYGAFEVRIPDAAPRLAAIVRVLVENARETEAMFGSMPGCSACCEGCKCEIEMVRDDTRTALARAEAIAKGE